jgi:hypothetical protein
MTVQAPISRLLWTKIVPLGFLLGAGMETFMYFTGFWNVATKKEAERRAERKDEIAALARLASKPLAVPEGAARANGDKGGDGLR